MRFTVLTCVFGAVFSVVSGCAINYSPMYSEIDTNQLHKVVNEYFFYGQPVSKVKHQLQRWGLPYYTHNLETSSHHTNKPHREIVYASVESRGITITAVPYASMSFARLTLYFDEAGALISVYWEDAIRNGREKYIVPLESEL